MIWKQFGSQESRTPLATPYTVMDYPASFPHLSKKVESLCFKALFLLRVHWEANGRSHLLYNLGRELPFLSHNTEVGLWMGLPPKTYQQSNEGVAKRRSTLKSLAEPVSRPQSYRKSMILNLKFWVVRKPKGVSVKRIGPKSVLRSVQTCWPTKRQFRMKGIRAKRKAELSNLEDLKCDINICGTNKHKSMRFISNIW